MLAPEIRSLLTDGLRPPDGTRLDLAVATTFSLDLNAMLLAPLSFALFDSSRSDPVAADPIRLLEAVRRYGERITVYCQAGGISVPASKFSPVLSFIENSVVEVAPDQGVFHPKVWVLRFVDADGAHIHRLLVLSRNLTFDRSWDTMLRLDEDADTAAPVPTKPLVDFLLAIPTIAVGDSRSDLIDELCRTIADATLSPPEPFTEAEFLPRGFGMAGYPFPETSDRALAISPFLDTDALAGLGYAKELILVSRPETLDRLGAAALDNVDTRTLQRIAEVHPDDEPAQSDLPSENGTSLSPPEGLHAKTYIFDIGREAEIITGSGNLTNAGWHRNVEFGVRLRGPKKGCGVTAALDGPAEAPGLEALLSSYVPENAEGETDPAEATYLAIERAHSDLVASRPRLTADALDSDQVKVELRTDSPWTGPGKTTVRLLTTPAQERTWGTGDPIAVWPALSRTSLTPYVVVETTAGEGKTKATRMCIVKAALGGDIGDRASDLLAQLLGSKEDVLRYLILLLGDPSYDSWAAQLGGSGERHFKPIAGYGADDYALFEPLIRAAGRDEVALVRVASLVDDLRKLEGGQDLTPDGFDDLWAAVWEVHQEASK